jgi:hypothetical protein
VPAPRVEEAIVGGFFVRDPYRALGALWIDGRPVAFEPVTEPYGDQRACAWSDGSSVRLAPLAELPRRGDLVQAGPLLVARREVMLAELGASDAINLDGGGSATPVRHGHLLNRPYSSRDQSAPQSRSVVSALAFP